MSPFITLVRAFAGLEKDAAPGDWCGFADETITTEEEFIAWARKIYRNTPNPAPRLRFVGAPTEDSCVVTAVTGFGEKSEANTEFIVAAVRLARACIAIAREKGDLDELHDLSGDREGPAPDGEIGAVDSGGERPDH